VAAIEDAISKISLVDIRKIQDGPSVDQTAKSHELLEDPLVAGQGESALSTKSTIIQDGLSIEQTLTSHDLLEDFGFARQGVSAVSTKCKKGKTCKIHKKGKKGKNMHDE